MAQDDDNSYVCNTSTTHPVFVSAIFPRKMSSNRCKHCTRFSTYFYKNVRQPHINIRLAHLFQTLVYMSNHKLQYILRSGTPPLIYLQDHKVLLSSTNTVGLPSAPFKINKYITCSIYYFYAWNYPRCHRSVWVSTVFCRINVPGVEAENKLSPMSHCNEISREIPRVISWIPHDEVLKIWLRLV